MATPARREPSQLEFGTYCRRARLAPAAAIFAFALVVPLLALTAFMALDMRTGNALQNLAAFFPSGRRALMGAGVALLGLSVVIPFGGLAWARRRYGHATLNLSGVVFVPVEHDLYVLGVKPCGKTHCASPGKRFWIPYAHAEWRVTPQGVLVWDRRASQPFRALFPFVIPARGDEAQAAVIHALESLTPAGIELRVEEVRELLEGLRAAAAEHEPSSSG